MESIRIQTTWLPMLVAGAVVLSSGTSLHADVKLPSFFSDHMVLQQEIPVKIWGRADPGEEVTVELAKARKTVAANEKGKWSVQLDSHEAGGPHVMTVQGKNRLVVDDVLIGEVWHCSGQSNMKWKMPGTTDFDKERPLANYPTIRTFNANGGNNHELPQEDCEGEWIVCSPDTLKLFSGAAYYFGRKLHLETDLPIGLLNTSRGAQPIESYLPPGVRQAHPELEPAFKALEKKITDWTPAKAQQRQMDLWRKKVDRAKRNAADWWRGENNRYSEASRSPGQTVSGTGQTHGSRQTQSSSARRECPTRSPCDMPGRTSPSAIYIIAPGCRQPPFVLTTNDLPCRRRQVQDRQTTTITRRTSHDYQREPMDPHHPDSCRMPGHRPTLLGSFSVERGTAGGRLERPV